MIAVMPEFTAPEIERATRHMLDKMVADGSTPGLQYVFASDRAVLFSHHGGAADLRTPRAVTEHSTFNAYSVTKTFTAAAVLQLADGVSSTWTTRSRAIWTAGRTAVPRRFGRRCCTRRALPIPTHCAGCTSLKSTRFLIAIVSSKK